MWDGGPEREWRRIMNDGPPDAKRRLDMNVQERSEVRDLTTAEVDEVTGGSIIVNAIRTAANHIRNSQAEPGGGQNGQNDPAQMFQQILEQVSQGG
jgi:hypothetical protein